MQNAREKNDGSVKMPDGERIKNQNFSKIIYLYRKKQKKGEENLRFRVSFPDF